MSIVTNRDAAEILFNVATILELAEDNPYRVRAYRRAARLLLANREDGRLRLTDKKELDLPGLGPSLRKKLGELLSTGHMRFYVELCADLPEEVAELMEIPGVGPKTALRLHEELGLSTAAEVYAAAQQGKIRALYGFGEKRERQLLHGAEQVMVGHPKILAPLPPETAEEAEPQPAEPAKPRLVPAHPSQLSFPAAA
jgi:DNA polymerase (family 10)